MIRFVGAPAAGPDVGVGGIEVHIGRDVVAWLDQHGAQNILGRPALVGGHEKAETKNLFDSIFQSKERARP